MSDVFQSGSTTGRALSQFDDLPIGPDITTQQDDRPLHPLCEPLASLLGVWRGEGEAQYPHLLGGFHYGQQIVFAHDGRPFLAYETRAWLPSTKGEPPAPSARERGWWRPQEDGSIEIVLTHAFGIVEIYYGGPTSDVSWEFETEAVVRTTTARNTVAAARLYGILDDGDLAYAEERALVGLPMAPHLSAQLRRIR